MLRASEARTRKAKKVVVKVLGELVVAISWQNFLSARKKQANFIKLKKISHKSRNLFYCFSFFISIKKTTQLLITGKILNDKKRNYFIPFLYRGFTFFNLYHMLSGTMDVICQIVEQCGRVFTVWYTNISRWLPAFE